MCKMCAIPLCESPYYANKNTVEHSKNELFAHMGDGNGGGASDGNGDGDDSNSDSGGGGDDGDD